MVAEDMVAMSPCFVIAASRTCQRGIVAACAELALPNSGLTVTQKSASSTAGMAVGIKVDAYFFKCASNYFCNIGRYRSGICRIIKAMAEA